jgi:hypothetical protein
MASGQGDVVRLQQMVVVQDRDWDWMRHLSKGNRRVAKSDRRGEAALRTAPKMRKGVYSNTTVMPA